MSVTKLNPYINFKNKAREALEFYKNAFGGKVTMTTFKDGGMSHSEADNELIMHGQLDADNGMTLMVSDSPSDWPLSEGSQISVSLSGDNAEELQGYWEKLSEGGKVTMPYSKAPWGDTFGMFTDKFGIAWMVNCAGKKE